MKVTNDVKKLEGEDRLHYIWRMYTSNKQTKKYTIEELGELCNDQLGELASESAFRKHFQYFDSMWEAVKHEYVDEDFIEERLAELEAKEKEVKKEVVKLRDLKLADNETIRFEARKEATLEEIQQYLQVIKPLEVPVLNEISNVEAVGIFGIADAHYGKELYISGFNGEPLNVYNPDIFEERMWRLMAEYNDIIKTEGITRIDFFELSDSIEGILRISGLQNIKYGITMSSVKYAQFMATWLNEFSKNVKIDYYACLGNHCEMRPLGSKSGDFPKENMQYIIDELLRAYLVNNDRVTIHDTKGLQYVDCGGFKVLAAHGQDERNLVGSVKEYKEIFDIKVDLMIAGHLHNSKQETASLHTKVVQFPSIIGIDSFSMKIKKTAKAEGKVILKKGNRFINIDIEV